MERRRSFAEQKPMFSCVQCYNLVGSLGNQKETPETSHKPPGNTSVLVCKKQPEKSDSRTNTEVLV